MKKYILALTSWVVIFSLVWLMPTTTVEAGETAPREPQGASYVIQSETYDWIQLDKTDTWIQDVSGSSSIPIGFSFTFFDNTYSNVYVNSNGYLSFGPGSNATTPQTIPTAGDPDNYIAPYWSHLYVKNQSWTDWIRYRNGGSAPNRYIIIQWNQAKDMPTQQDGYKFEVILHENGDIVFQYNSMTFLGDSCGVSGVENAGGTAGTATTQYCGQPTARSAVRLHRIEAPAGAEVVLTTPRSALVEEEGTAQLRATLRNDGLTTAASVILTATLGHHLAYANATPAATVNGNMVVWSLPDIAYQGSQEIMLYTSVPTRTIFGAGSNITWTVTTAGPEENHADNTGITGVYIILEKSYLPLIVKNFINN